MKLGLLADVHEHVDNLRAALDRLHQAEVDQVVILGDVFSTGEQIDETCRLLSDANAVGVWGNHDFGLSLSPTPYFTERYGAEVPRFMTTLHAHLVIDGCLCTHVEPWLDPHKVLDLWYFDGEPDTPEKTDRIFEAVSESVIFGGHYHRWLLVTPDGIQPWRGETPIRLAADQRYFVVVDALVLGSYAIYDTQSRELIPLQVRGQGTGDRGL